MDPNLQNRKNIFIVFLIVAILGYFFTPWMQQYIPNVDGKSLQDLDTYFIPNEKTIISSREILSQARTKKFTPPEYLVCSINDDPDGINNYGIYDPTDLAVTVSNLIRLGSKHLLLGTHLHWPDLPKNECNTLRTQLELLESCIISTPLRRAADSVEIPNYLLKSSLSLGEIKGNVLTLPRVNNLSLAPTLSIPNNCRVGFSQLESEMASVGIPLLALWDERVVLSSLLLERMHHLKLKPDDLEVIVGKFIVLGDTGNLIPINEFGYFTPLDDVVTVKPDIIAAEIIPVKELSLKTPYAVLTAEGVLADDYRAIESPVKQLTQLTLTPVYEDRHIYNRIFWWLELALSVLILVLLIIAVRCSVIVFFLWFCFLVAGLLGFSFLLSRYTYYYIPSIYLLLALSTCLLVFLGMKIRSSRISKQNDDEEAIEEDLLTDEKGAAKKNVEGEAAEEEQEREDASVDTDSELEKEFFEEQERKELERKKELEREAQLEIERKAELERQEKEERAAIKQRLEKLVEDKLQKPTKSKKTR